MTTDHFSGDTSGDDSDRVDVYTEALLDGQSVADVIIDTMTEEEILEIASYPDLSWSTIADQRDSDAAIRLLEHRFQASFLASYSERVCAELDSSALARDANIEPALEQLAMRAVTALAWSDPQLGLDYYRRYYTGDLDNPETTAAYAACQRVLTLAPSWRQLGDECEVPAPLQRFVTLQWVVSAPVLDEMIAMLRQDMTGQPLAYLHVFDCMDEHYPQLLHFIANLTGRFLPADLPSLGELGETEHKALATAMDEIDAPMRGGMRLSHLMAAALTVGAGLSIAGYDDVALIASLVLGLSAVLYSIRTERWLYRRQARPRLAEYLAEVGTPTECVVSWLMENRQAVKRIRSFNDAIDGDSALDVLARLGRMARLHR